MLKVYNCSCIFSWIIKISSSNKSVYPKPTLIDHIPKFIFFLSDRHNHLNKTNKKTMHNMYLAYMCPINYESLAYDSLERK